MQRLIPTLLLCTLATAAFADGNACHPASGREIQVTGNATVALPPDQVAFNVGVESRSAKVAEAFRGNSEKANAIIAALKKLGVKKDEIRTSELSIRSYSERNNSQVIYIVSNQISVTRKELSNIGELIQAAVEKGANQADSLYFSASDSREARKRALQLAYEDARDKATQLAALAGKGLGEALCVSELGADSPRPLAASRMKAEAFAAAPNIETGTLQLSFSIGVVFELK